jgi:glycosyltransferase involved in cell wall biosynthesis
MNNFMNIGIDIRPLMAKNKTGVGEYTEELLNAVFKLDKANQYFLFYNSYEDVSENIPKWEQDNIHYVLTKWPNKIFNASIGLFGVPKLDLLSFPRKRESNTANLDSCFRRNDNVDVFFSPNLNFISLSKKTKLILTVHDLSFELFPEFYTLKQRLWHRAINPKKLCKRADLILTPSENTKRDIVDYYKIPGKKIKVIYPGNACHSCDRPRCEAMAVEKSRNPGSPAMDSGSWSGMTDKDPSTPLGMTIGEYFLFLGTIEPRKNIPGLIKAFEIFNFQFPISNFNLIIAGAPGWKNREIFDLIDESPSKEKIKYIGCVKNADKPALYSNASLFIYPSFYEGFGFPVLEAMASGVPVITSNRSSLPEITETNATLIDPNHPEQIAWAMNNILTNQTLRETQIKNGLLQAAKFSWEGAARQWLSVLPT